MTRPETSGGFPLAAGAAAAEFAGFPQLLPFPSQTLNLVGVKNDGLGPNHLGPHLATLGHQPHVLRRTAVELGGLGRGAKTLVPPVIARADFPEAWRILLIFDSADIGVHGNEEVEAFRTLPEFPADVAAELCRRVLMQALPALAEHDLKTFGAAIRELQVRTGDYFAPVQGGRYASAGVASVLDWLEHNGVLCLGQSSWGPTGFAVFSGEVEADKYLQAARKQFSAMSHLSFLLCKGRNRGGILRDIN